MHKRKEKHGNQTQESKEMRKILKKMQTVNKGNEEIYIASARTARGGVTGKVQQLRTRT